MSTRNSEPAGLPGRESAVPVLWAWCHTAGIARTWDFEVMSVDAVVVDLQHGDIDTATLPSLVSVLEQQNVAPVARLASHDRSHIGHVLDCGVHAVIVPQVDSPEQALDALAACRYAPQGYRSYGRKGRFQGEPVCIVQVETSRGLESVEAIAATPGLYGMYVGPWDLGLAIGADPGRLTDPLINAAVTRVATACRGNTLRWGVHTTELSAVDRAHALGADLINVVADQSALAEYARRTRNTVDLIRTCQKGQHPC